MIASDGAEELLDENTSKLFEECEKRRLKSLELSNKKLKSFPIRSYDIKHIQFLYLEKNYLEGLSEDFFPALPLLKWLDVRHNHLRSLPNNIHIAKNLRNLLLEGNQLSHLPFELGLLTSLSGLNLIGNPLVVPPQEVVACGAKVILKYLREQLAIEQKFGKMDLGDVVGDSRHRHKTSEDFSDEESTIPFEAGAGYSANTFATNDTTHFSTNNIDLETKTNTDTLLTQKLEVSLTPNDSEQTSSLDHVGKSDQVLPTQKSMSKKLSKSNQKCDNIRAHVVKTRSDIKQKSKSDSKLETKENAHQRRVADKKKILTENLANRPQTSPSELNLIRRKSRQRKREVKKEDNKSRIVNLTAPTSTKDIGESTNAKKRVNPLVTQMPRFKDLKMDSMVALRLSDHHFIIPGQPSLGKIILISDSHVTVHMFTGSFGGAWWPMMSRQSPYTREVSLDNVVHQFELDQQNMLFAKDVDLLKALCKR
ncbi:E3 ubiquitin-protein ligase LRSAM1-like isoform X1 [Clytia hemisphaerica]|uniref:Leucine rich repeat containing protein n=1 Tax=Clytia hemisphaerica TaxID=252671 RepID=A0A7M5V4M7_9CNID